MTDDWGKGVFGRQSIDSALSQLQSSTHENLVGGSLQKISHRPLCLLFSVHIAMQWVEIKLNGSF